MRIGLAAILHLPIPGHGDTNAHCLAADSPSNGQKRYQGHHQHRDTPGLKPWKRTPMSIYATEAPLVTEEERQRLYKRMEQQQPELWLRLYPRHYPAPPTCGEYYSAEDPGHFFLWQYHRVDHNAGVAEQPLMAMGASLMNGGMPMMWLSPGLVEAIQHTFPASNLDWTTMSLPSASMVMMVPRRTLVHPTEGDVRFIAYSRIGYVGPDGRCDWMFSFVPYTRKYPCLVQLSGDRNPMVPFEALPSVYAAGVDFGTQERALHPLFAALLLLEAPARSG
jgi:hypothetical protein